MQKFAHKSKLIKVIGLSRQKSPTKMFINVLILI